ncbi:MAG: hypothetical protein WCZ89_08790 [Phycisphaerae bacterium]
MLTERKKMMLILVFLVGAILINVSSLLFDFLYESDFARFLFNIGLTRWGWLPAIVFLISAITLLVLWKPGNLILRLILITASILMLIYDFTWLAGIYFISGLNP